MRGGARVPAGGEVEVQPLLPRVGLREVEIAQVVDGDQAGTGMGKGQDVGWDEERIWRAACHLPGETQMCPQARKGDDAEVGTGEGASRGCAAEVKAEAMRAVERQQRLNEALGVNLGASRAGADGATGVNPD